jgi:hypothetical protein
MVSVLGGAASTSPPSDRGAAETDLVAVQVAEDDLADAICVGLAFGGLQSRLGDQMVMRSR